VQDKWKFAVIGALAGTVATFVFAAPSIVPLAWADEQPIRAMQAVKQELLDTFDGNAELFKPNWTVEDTVSTEVLSTQTVRKIEAGRTSFVTIATTSSGVYSSDALDSPNVRYPGIHAEGHQKALLAILTGGGWAFITPVDAGSFAHIIPNENGGAIVSGGSACHFVNGNMYC